MKLKISYIIFVLLLLMSFASSDFIELSYPDYFPKPHYKFNQNRLTQEKINLGRALFYDPILSADNSTSCASCHSPYNAFAHTDHDLSHGIHDSIGTRNAPALFNLAWQKSFMWDGAVNHLDMQALAPIAHPAEMGSSMESVLEKLNASDIYKDLSMKAFDDKTLTGEYVLKALSQFQLTLISAGSKYDKVRSGLDTFNLQEQSGYALFKNNCAQCHSEPLFTTRAFKNNGLKIDSTLNDRGRYAITQNKRDDKKFKIPSLRNIEYTKPYMHDGRFQTLNAVLKHYTSGIADGPTLDPSLKNKIELTSNEQVDLIAFLLTLSDKEFVFNPDNKYPRDILLPKY